MWYLAVVLLFSHYGVVLCYKAAVVEYSPLTAKTSNETIFQNLEKYKQFTQEAKKQSADIIVFPEYGLTTMVVNPEMYSIEINSHAPLVLELSTLAKKHSIYLIVNLLEKVSSRKTQYYNTNLVFDRSGRLILQYRKINLFGEPNLRAGPTNQTNTFTTDFGTTFGIFTCFDILYRNPSRTILNNNKNIRDIVYPTSWFSTMPFYAALNIQHGYAISANVNLLAANLGEPQNTHGGSGIYVVNGTSKIHISGVPKSELLVLEVPIKRKYINAECLTTKSVQSQPSDMMQYKTLKDFKPSDYNFKKVDLGKENQTIKICYESFCCSFEIILAELGHSDNYKVMAFDGVVPFDQSTADIRVCSLLLCANDSNASCGIAKESTTKFSKISVQGKFEKNGTTFYNPLTLDSLYRPLTESAFCRINDPNSVLVTLNTLQHYYNVVLFGIFGRTD